MVAHSTIENFKAQNQDIPKNNGNQSRGEITANRGKFCFKSNGNHFFDKSRLIALQSVFQKTMAINREVKSRQIAGNPVLKVMAITFLTNRD